MGDLGAGAIIAIIVSVVGLVITYSVTLAGVIMWLNKQFQFTRHAASNAVLQAKTDTQAEIDKLEKRVRTIEQWTAARNGVEIK